jgi:hypothetical protein
MDADQDGRGRSDSGLVGGKAASAEALPSAQQMSQVDRVIGVISGRGGVGTRGEGGGGQHAWCGGDGRTTTASDQRQGESL